MRKILRSPIEPEFVEYLGAFLRRKELAFRKGLQDLVLAAKAFFRRRKESFSAGIERRANVIRLWGEHIRFEWEQLRKKQSYLFEGKKEEPSHAEALSLETQELEQKSSFAFSSRAVKERVFGSLPAIKKLGFVRLKAQYIFFLVLVVGILAGGALKSVARETITIGFEDYKAGSTKNLVDLNTIQTRVMTQDPTQKTDVEGKQCTE